jgi:hypothetical protein
MGCTNPMLPSGWSAVSLRYFQAFRMTGSKVALSR